MRNTAGGRKEHRSGDIDRLLRIIGRAAEKPVLLALTVHTMTGKVDDELVQIVCLNKLLDCQLDASRIDVVLLVREYDGLHLLIGAPTSRLGGHLALHH